MAAHRRKLPAEGDGLSHRAQARGRLRQIAQLLAFALPVSLLIAALLGLPWPYAAVLSALAASAQFAGMLVERWLFFAEAKHTVTLYYGR